MGLFAASQIASQLAEMQIHSFIYSVWADSWDNANVYSVIAGRNPRAWLLAATLSDGHTVLLWPRRQQRHVFQAASQALSLSAHMNRWQTFLLLFFCIWCYKAPRYLMLAPRNVSVWVFFGQVLCIATSQEFQTFFPGL